MESKQKPVAPASIFFRGLLALYIRSLIQRFLLSFYCLGPLDDVTLMNLKSSRSIQQLQKQLFDVTSVV